MARQIAEVRWGLVTSREGLYGTRLEYHDDGTVCLSNPGLPSALTLQTWSSSSDFQKDRHTPTLPLLNLKSTYRLVPRLVSSPADGVIFCVQTRDRFDALIAEEFLYGPDYRFTLPPKGTNYTISLLSAGFDSLRFTSFELWEVEDD
ncbi:MAG: accessory Sec system protein Asp3 [Promicromonosporaceae bacterium]|nr:accessory Sec system protein Asp3 [Promicromonosporaceae bacterium]